MKLCRFRLSLAAGAALVSLLSFATVSSGQNTNTNNRAGRRGPMLEQRLDRISTELNLNDDQKAKLKALFQKQAKERREIVADTNLPRAERREKMRVLAEEQKSQLKTILTAEQLEKWQALREQMRANRPRRPSQDGEPAPAAAPAPTPAPNSGSDQAK